MIRELKEVMKEILEWPLGQTLIALCGAINSWLGLQICSWLGCSTTVTAWLVALFVMCGLIGNVTGYYLASREGPRGGGGIGRFVRRLRARRAPALLPVPAPRLAAA